MGEGTVDWDSVFEAIRGTGGGLHLVLEYDAGTPLEKLAEGKKMLEQAFGISD
jgi:sugar phosphate isomerase/epimerase